METREFVRLVGEMLEAMDQHLAEARPVRDGFVVRSTDGFLFVFAPRAERVSPASVRHWLEEGAALPERLVLFSPEPLPGPVRDEVDRGGGTLVAGPSFANLLRQLGIDPSALGPARALEPSAGHYLPTVEGLEAIIGRARSWEESGVPALSLRFFRQAAALKPEYVPALLGVARSLAMLGVWKEADRAWRDVLAIHPGDVDAQLGRAAVLGALGRTAAEIDAFRRLVRDHPELTAGHAGLLAGLIESERWPEARAETEVMLRASPSDAHLRLLSALACEAAGDLEGAGLELNTARALGLTPEQEASTRHNVQESIRSARARIAARSPPGAPLRSKHPPPLPVAPRRVRAVRKPKLSSST